MYVRARACARMYNIKNKFYETQELAHIHAATNTTVNLLCIRKASSVYLRMVQQHTWVVLLLTRSEFYFTTVINL